MSLFGCAQFQLVMKTFWTAVGAEPRMAVHPAAIAWPASIVSIVNTAASRQDIFGDPAPGAGGIAGRGWFG